MNESSMMRIPLEEGQEEHLQSRSRKLKTKRMKIDHRQTRDSHLITIRIGPKAKIGPKANLSIKANTLEEATNIDIRQGITQILDSMTGIIKATKQLLTTQARYHISMLNNAAVRIIAVSMVITTDNILRLQIKHMWTDTKGF